jgi:hypothetical protein
MSKKVRSLKEVLPENTAIQANLASTPEAEYFSTVEVESTAPFDSETYKLAAQAKAGLATHLNLAATHPAVGHEPLAQLKNDLMPLVNQLSQVRLPDTRVNVGGIKMEIRASVKQYANDINQEKYTTILFHLLGKERMRSVYGHATRSGQNSRIALWLNQAVEVETRKPYVYTLARSLEELIPDRQSLVVDAEKTKVVEEALKFALGPELYPTLCHVANVNELTPFVVFILLIETIIKERTAQSVPTTTSSIWDEILDIGEEPKRPENTAARLRGEVK